MTNKTMTLNLPASIAKEISAASEDFFVDIIERGLREMKIDRTLARYAQGGFSFGAAAHQAGISQSELARYAYARGIEPPFTNETLIEEMS
ncbi:MAG: hypothetical protein U9Q82_05020 [Chloroflexota bacterium]|nr:hypothetical protein [Chloroflexota bacterium]